MGQLLLNRKTLAANWSTAIQEHVPAFKWPGVEHVTISETPEIILKVSRHRR